MQKTIENLRGVFKANVKNLQKEDGRCNILVEVISSELDFNYSIYIDIHDSICETAGVSVVSRKLLSKIYSNLPRTIRISNINGYWEIENESQLLSDAISKSL